MSGYPGIVAEKGVDMSYQLAPRAKIFRRDADKVVDMETMKHIMRYNGKLYIMRNVMYSSEVISINLNSLNVLF